MGIKIIKIATLLHDGVMLIKLLVKSLLIKKTLLNISKIGNKNITYLNVLGNGPSLKKDLEWIRSNRGHLDGEHFIGVNFFALSEEYIETKPFIYVLADPLFWRNDLVNKLDEKKGSFNRHIEDDMLGNEYFFARTGKTLKVDRKNKDKSKY